MSKSEYNALPNGSPTADIDGLEEEVKESDPEKRPDDHDVEPASSQRGTLQNALVGAFFGLGVCFSFVVATQFVQSTYSETFNGPFFNMWFSTCWMMLCYPLNVLGTLIISREKRKNGVKRMFAEDQLVYGKKGITIFRAVWVTGPFLILWMLTNYVFVRALGITSATVVTTLFVTNTAFVYILSWILLTEVLAQVPSKTLSVIISIAGTVLVSYSEGFEAGHRVVGAIVLPLLAALGSAAYKVIFKRVIGDASCGQVSLFLSVLGFLNMVCLWPVLLIPYYTGEESWDVMPWGFLCGSAALILVFNFLVNFGIAVTFPLLISLGHVLGIPVNAVVDFTFRGTSFGALKLVGGGLIVVGFIFMILPANIQEKMAFGFFKKKQTDETEPGKEETFEAEEMLDQNGHKEVNPDASV